MPALFDKYQCLSYNFLPKTFDLDHEEQRQDLSEDNISEPFSPLTESADMVKNRSSVSIPNYAKPFMDDLTISNNCKELFRALFIETLNPETLKNALPLEKLVQSDGALQKKLAKFNDKHDNIGKADELNCRGSAHSAYPNDPWQTIKVTAPNVKIIGKTSPLLLELKKGLDEHYHIKSGGGGNWEEWLEKSFDEKMQQNKYDPECFRDSYSNNLMNPQMMLTLIDIKKIVGMIPSDQEYVMALGNAYFPQNDFNGDQYANPQA